MCVCVCVLVNDVVYFIVFSISKNLPDPYIIYTIFNIQFLIFHLCSTSNILDTGQSKRKTFSLLFSKFISSAITKLITPSLPNMIEWSPAKTRGIPQIPARGKKFCRRSFFINWTSPWFVARVPQSRSRWRTSILRATSFRGEQFCVARLSTLFSKLEIACWKVLLQPLLLR